MWDLGLDEMGLDEMGLWKDETVINSNRFDSHFLVGGETIKCY
jgi:hypothetical protein